MSAFITGFIILYRTDLEQGLYDSSITVWWDSGPQKELKKFADKNHLVSFDERLNHEQIEAIRKFLGCTVICL